MTIKTKYSRFFAEKLIHPIKGFLLQGIGPERLSLTIAAGLVLGVFPVWGTTTFLCAGVALLFRLNMAAIQLANYFVYPLQIILIVPFIKLGQFIFGLNPLPYTLEEMVEMMRSDTLQGLEKLGWSLLIGVGTWALLSVPLFFLFYLLFKPLLKRLIKQSNQTPIQDA